MTKVHDIYYTVFTMLYIFQNEKMELFMKCEVKW